MFPILAELVEVMVEAGEHLPGLFIGGEGRVAAAQCGEIFSLARLGSFFPCTRSNLRQVRTV